MEQQASKALGRQVTVGITFTRGHWSWRCGLRIAKASGSGRTRTRAKPSDSASQLSIQRLYANAELASLFNLAPVVDAVRVEHPVLSLARREDGQLDVQDILDHLAANATPPEPNRPAPAW